MPYPAIEFMLKHFKQVEKLGVDAPDMYAKPTDDSPHQSHEPDSYLLT